MTTSEHMPLAKILVANRSEIAIRVIRAIHRHGAKAVAVYSDPDERALHVTRADEAYRIGPGPAAESYLNGAAIIDVATAVGVDAIHPGYGFLSENADFAQSVIEAGIAFIGPPPGVMRSMGDKIAAKRLMRENNVPLIPGYEGDDQSDETFVREANRIGYPIMVKAAAGGGGRGMRTVTSATDLSEALAGARREAAAAFGCGRLFLERLLVAPHHIEVQVLGDVHGNLIHLFERDCSVQRRHQKVIEEAPSPVLTTTERQAICEAGVRAARAAGYVNAGTVEFLWQEGCFYFLEMNTRIQVEHAVTEQVTGTDLVLAQIEIAEGQTLRWTQGDVTLAGHAIEARLYAEDAQNSFLPQSGRVLKIELGHNEAIRVDSGVESGSEVSRFYDSMIAKVIATGQNRDDARQRLLEELAVTDVIGVTTNIDFVRWLLATSEFAAGTATTSLAESWMHDPATVPTRNTDDYWVLGMLGCDLAPALAESDHPRLMGWRLGGQGVRLAYEIGGVPCRAEASRSADGSWGVLIDGARRYENVRFHKFDGVTCIAVRIGSDLHSFEWRNLDPESGELSRSSDDSQTRFVRRRAWHDLRARAPVEAGSNHAGMVSAPMPGVVIKVHVCEGDRVAAHQPLVVMEAMKMEHVLEATHPGVVSTVHHTVGDLVRAGESLVEIRES
jgi:3-methylcrotonyl-CoA carboxylase alpha subunit